MNILKKYKFSFLMIFIMVVIFMINKETGIKAFSISVSSFKEMLLVLPPIFILLGLLDVWIPKETMIKYMGEKSGVKGIVLSIIIGSAAAGPLYGAFPIAAVFMKKGVKFSNIVIFIGAWSTTKIPMFLFEISALGARFALTRLVADIFGIIFISYLLTSFISKEEVVKIYEDAEKL